MDLCKKGENYFIEEKNGKVYVKAGPTLYVGTYLSTFTFNADDPPNEDIKSKILHMSFITDFKTREEAQKWIDEHT